MAAMPSDLEPESVERDVVLGVDTHADVHVAVVLSAVGRVLGSDRFPTTTAGYRDLIGWARGHGELRQAGIEGTGSYGAALSRLLRAAGVQVIEVNRPDRSARRRHGKSDLVDAQAAARAVLAQTATATPKSGDGPVEALRVLKLAKGSAVKARVQALNQLRAVLVNADPELRDSLRSLRTQKLITACADLEVPDAAAVVRTATVHTLRQLGRRIQYLADEIREFERRIDIAVTSAAPQLLDLHGIGPDAAATLLITAGDNPGRLTSEASFAALCGVTPVEASSGKTQRRRLNRGGNRQANAALYRAVLIGLRWNPETREYARRRSAEGKTKREIIRCLKRYLARTIYRIIAPTPPRSGPLLTT